MKNSIIISLILLFTIPVFAQKYITKTGFIQFYSETPMETIQADNQQVNAAYDASNGMFVFKVLMKSFEFEKALMQEHFNENYIESDQFPNATFKGTVENYTDVNLTQNGSYPVKVKGELTLHGVTLTIEEDGTMVVEGDMIHASSKFNLKPADFNIKIPGAVVKNIAENIEVRVDVKLNKLEK